LIKKPSEHLSKKQTGHPERVGSSDNTFERFCRALQDKPQSMLDELNTLKDMYNYSQTYWM